VNIYLKSALFASLVAAQLAVPFSMIAGKEDVLKTGQAFKFRAAPVDPYDAFRGRYVALGFKEDEAPAPASLRRGQKAYAAISIARDGFARVDALTAERPRSGPYFAVKVQYTFDGKARFDLPFDRYYMEESAAPKAERVQRERARGEEAYAVVRVKEGKAVLEALFIGGELVEEVARKKAAS
jgi:uncharacterized membrane-anchored protein